MQPGDRGDAGAEIETIIAARDDSDWLTRYRALEAAAALPAHKRARVAEAFKDDENEWVRALAMILTTGPTQPSRRSRTAMAAQLDTIIGTSAISVRQRQRLLRLFEDVEAAGALSFLALTADRASRLVTGALRNEADVVAVSLRRLELFLRHVAAYADSEHPSRIVDDVGSVVQAATASTTLSVIWNFGVEARINLEASRRALNEIVSNAEDASARDLRLDIVRNDGHIVVTATNNGDALAVDLEDRVFEPWFTTRPGHAGLGLPLARSMVESAGGTIRVVSTDPVAFELSLPIERS